MSRSGLGPPRPADRSEAAAGPARPGTTRRARYEDLRRIGRGGHATVYRAFDRELGVDVAIKILHKNRSTEELRAGLINEVKISRLLRHPNICPIHDLYEGPEGTGIVMDFIDGVTLAKWMQRHGGRRLETARQRRIILMKVLDALTVAHRHIVHRDLKPDNIFLKGGDPDTPIIMDFGVSILGIHGDEAVTGTPKYMAPEQFEAPEQVDRRSDLFSVGILAYELFTETIPPNSNVRIRSMYRAARVPLEDITPPSRFCPAVPPGLDRLILQMTAFDRDDRPGSAEEVLALMRRFPLTDATDCAPIGGGRARERVLVDGGLYRLGSRPDGPNQNEKPARRVTLSPFAIDVTPVTNLDYRRFCDATGSPLPPLSADPVFGRDDHPVVAVTWSEAVAFAAWAGGRLPSEAEWECAARAGTVFAEYPWGDRQPARSEVNIGGVWGSTSPVGAHPAAANALGLQDMAGNVWEWCRDSFDPDFYGSLGQGDLDPCCQRDGSQRSLRGGSFASFASQGRVAFRGHADASERRRDIGFRVVYPASDIGAPTGSHDP